MTTKRIKRMLLLVAAIAAVVPAAGATVAQAAPVASKFVFSSHFGWDVNKTTGGDICTVASKDECQFPQGSSEPGGFEDAESVAVDNDPESPDDGDVYVADVANDRVQEFTASGEFVLMFGKDVNETTGGNVCTEEEIKNDNVKCKAGVPGNEAGAMNRPHAVAVDSSSGNVYVAEWGSGGGVVENDRVDEFTATGEFVLTVGGEVNETKVREKAEGKSVTEEAENLCTAISKDECQEGKDSAAHGAFNFVSGGRGNALAVGGPEDLLYVGDEHRVQEFEADGEWKREISLTLISSEPGWIVQALAVDETGDVYLAYGYREGKSNMVREFTPAGVQSAQFEVAAEVRALALDPHGRLGVLQGLAEEVVGVIYSTSGAKISEFAPPSGNIGHNAAGLAFSASDELYVASQVPEVEAYAPALFPESVTCPATEVLATSARLCGEINANGLQTRGFFDYSPPVGGVTPVAFEGSGIAREPFSSSVRGLEPNETYTYKVVAEAEVAGEEVTGAGEPLSFHTATPPPEVSGVPSASDVTDAFALLSASVNPEHALTRYHFEYGPCAVLAGCVGVASTPGLESPQYVSVGAIQEAVGLQPDTTYSFRLVADNRHEETGHVLQGGETVGAEGRFTTGASPVPTAETGGASGVGATGATIAGAVDPDGQPAVYTFELGVYNGAGTQYGVVFSGPAGASTSPVGESLPLSGLQPGTTYAYRIVVKSGYGVAVGATATFTTEGLPAVIAVPVPLQMLAVPEIAFPTETRVATTTKKTAPKCKKGKKLTRGACVKVKAKAKKGSAARKRARKQAKR